MKRILHRSPRLPLLCVILGMAASLSGAVVPSEWRHRQNLQVAAPGLVSVVLPEATFDAAKPGLADLRIIDGKGREVPYLIDQPPRPETRSFRAAVWSFEVTSEGSVITATSETTEPLDALLLETPHPHFLRSVSISKSDDRVRWTPMDHGLPLFRQYGAERLEIPLRGIRAAQVRVIIADKRLSALPITGVKLRLGLSKEEPPVAVGSRIVSRQEYAGESVLTLELAGSRLPLARAEFVTPEALFMRRISFTVREVQDGVPVERTVGEGSIFRVSLDGAPERTLLEVPLSVVPASRDLFVHVHNGDAPPLAIDSLHLKRQPLSLFFHAPAAGSYYLLTGNAQAAAPHYDLAAFSADLHTAEAQTLKPEALENTPNFRQADAMASVSLPDAVFGGAPFEGGEWPLRNEVLITKTGVQELELDTAVLSACRSDFGDLRIVRADRQLPYLLEATELSRLFSLSPEPKADPKRPGFSCWSLAMPHPGLPLKRLVLRSSSPLFERELRIYERLKDSNGREYQRTLASGRWSRTPESGSAEIKAFDISERLQSDRVWIETDNGDNAGIELGIVQAFIPVVRVVFMAPETDGYDLVYGFQFARAPRYDLRLIASKLYGSGRNQAVLKPGARDREAWSLGRALGMLRGGILLWSVLLLVVIALLCVVAKLLPKAR